MKTRLNPRKVFWKCGACSHAMFHLLNHEFNNEKPAEEQASDILAGGIAQKGHQCGMLWGGSLAVGAESYHRIEDKNQAIVIAVNTTRDLISSFKNRTKTLQCRDISGTNWENRFDLFIYLIKTLSRGFVYSPCFNLIVKWTPEALETAGKGLNATNQTNIACKSCSSEVVKQMGATEEESMMVAGFAGGLGLSGNACGALSAAIWFKMLQWSNEHSGKSPGLFNNSEAKKIFRAFFRATDSEIMCEKITGKRFASIEEHTEYLGSGGCKHVIDTLATI